MRPPPPLRICGSAAREQRIATSVLPLIRAMIWLSVATSIDFGVASTLDDALFTSTSSRPNRTAVSSTTR